MNYLATGVPGGVGMTGEVTPECLPLSERRRLRSCGHTDHPNAENLIGPAVRGHRDERAPHAAPHTDPPQLGTGWCELIAGYKLTCHEARGDLGTRLTGV